MKRLITLKSVVTPMQQSPERQPEIKELFFFRVKKEVLKLSNHCQI
jgi:hypothetical protein